MVEGPCQIGAARLHWGRPTLRDLYSRKAERWFRPETSTFRQRTTGAPGAYLEGVATDTHWRPSPTLSPGDASPDVNPGVQRLSRASSISHLGNHAQSHQYLVSEGYPVDEEAHVCQPGLI